MSLVPTLQSLFACAEWLGIGILQHPYLYAAGAFLGWYVVYQRYFHPLSRFPGPFFASLSEFWKVSDVLSYRQALNDYELHKKYGPVFRDGPNSVSVSDARAVEPIYGAKNDLDRGTWYVIFGPDGPDDDFTAFASRRAEQHRRLRKRVAKIYSMGSALSYEPIIDRNINDLLAWFKKLGTLDISLWTHYFTMDAMSEMAYGDRMGFLVKGTDIGGYQKALRDSVALLVSMGYLTTLTYTMKSRWLGPYIGPSAKDKHGYGYLIGIAERLADNILLNGNPSGKKTMSHELSLCRNEDGTPISRRELVGEMLIFTTGGSDPAAYIISMILNNILRHEPVRVKVLAELKEAGALESSAAGVVTYAQTTRLEYFHAIIQESLRLSPAFQANLPRITPPRGLEVLPGVYLPPGVTVSANSYTSQRDRAVFGSDAEEFVPERWLPIGGERYRHMARHMIVWGYGSTKCLGQNIAMLKINKCVIEILRRFDFNLTEPSVPLKERNINQMYISDLFVKFTEREKKLGI